ncbi:MAG: glycosyltransferase family 2 protein [Bacteroidetes bacterium]|nr:glycosyltransferase family 2 protein [Bacteroidota bacterium]
MQNSSVAIVILNWNGLELLKKFLPSVMEYSDFPNCRIYVADNASTDDSVKFLKESYGSKITIIKNDGNYGYAKGYNLALEGLTEDYFVLLNSDVEVTPQWIGPVISLMESNTSIAACQPKLLSYKNKDTFEYAGASGGHMDKYGYPFCKGRIFDSFEKDLGQYQESESIFWASGAGIFVRSDAFRAADGFDEDLFAHMEEIDLCWRFKRMGYDVRSCPDSVIYHLGGGTLSEMSPRKTYLNFRNNRLILTKNIERRYFLIIYLIRNVMDMLAAVQALFAGKPLDCLAILRALFHYHLMLPSWISKRKQLKNKIALHNDNTLIKVKLYHKSIVYQYFVKGIKKYSELP